MNEQTNLDEQGASGVGFGNFQEIGPLDTDLKPRNSTWLQKADLLFVVLSLFQSLFRWVLNVSNEKAKFGAGQSSGDWIQLRR